MLSLTAFPWPSMSVVTLSEEWPRCRERHVIWAPLEQFPFVRWPSRTPPVVEVAASRCSLVTAPGIAVSFRQSGHQTLSGVPVTA